MGEITGHHFPLEWLCWPSLFTCYDSVLQEPFSLRVLQRDLWFAHCNCTSAASAPRGRDANPWQEVSGIPFCRCCVEQCPTPYGTKLSHVNTHTHTSLLSVFCRHFSLTLKWSQEWWTKWQGLQPNPCLSLIPTSSQWNAWQYSASSIFNIVFTCVMTMYT